MPTVVNTETSAARNSTSSISRSRITRARRRARRSPCMLVGISVVWPGTADIGGKAPRFYKNKIPPGKRSASGMGFFRRKRLLVLGFALQQLVDRHAHFGHATEHRALLALLHMLERYLVGRIGQRQEGQEGHGVRWRART